MILTITQYAKYHVFIPYYLINGYILPLNNDLSCLFHQVRLVRFDTWGNYILTGVGNEQVSDEEEEPDEGRRHTLDLSNISYARPELCHILKLCANTHKSQPC